MNTAKPINRVILGVGIAALGIFLLGLAYIYFAGRALAKVDQMWALNGLRTIQACWLDQGKPADFDPTQCVRYERIEFRRDTNIYAFGTRQIRAVATAWSKGFRWKDRLVICEDGGLFWIDPNGRARPVGNEKRLWRRATP